MSKLNDYSIIGTRWDFRNKLDKNGHIIRNKVRLVAKWYNQEKWIDYDKTFTPIAKLEAIRMLLACVYGRSFKIFQIM